MKKIITGIVSAMIFILVGQSIIHTPVADEENYNKEKVQLKNEEIQSGEINSQEDIIVKDDTILLPTATPTIDNMLSEEISVEAVATSYQNYKNDTCAWGFVRKKNGVKPDFYGPHKKILDENKGVYCDTTDEPILYLTFDEGYENGYTGPILDTLKEKNATAIFFVTMPYVKQNPELVQRMIDEGHMIGNHTVNHPSMPSITDDQKLMKEIMDLHDYVKEKYNYVMTFLRPPKGEYSERTVKLALDLGYRTVLWSSAYDDWDTSKQDRLDYARNMILNNLHNGSVMLLHAVSKDNSALLGEVIDEARNRGFDFVSLEEFPE